MSTLESGIAVEGLSFTYPGAQAATLLDIDFKVDAGDSLALLGSSGAGKTTLLNLLSGLLPFQNGQILFDGRDVSALAAGRRGVAQVFQFPVLYESLDVQENIAFALRTQGVGRKERGRRAAEVAELFDLQPLLMQKPTELSLFEKQLTGVAKALIRDDLSLVLLDEPLTAVEPAMKWRLRRAVKRAQAELGVTMIYVTHDQTEALTFADRVSVLHDGYLLQTGTPAELYDRPTHAEVARFIGRPGMNVVPGALVEGQLTLSGVATGATSDPALVGALAQISDGALELGFRPEWSELIRSGGPSGSETRPGVNVAVEVLAERLTGATATQTHGIAQLGIGEHRVQVGCALDQVHPTASAVLHITRCLLFRDGKRVAEISL